MTAIESNDSESLSATPRTQIKRLPQRGNYDRPTIYRILDEGLICHVGFVANDQPFVIPTAYGRVDDRLYIHGSPASRMLRTLKQGIEVCVTVTLLDGLVLARSAFHHSMNYRSVVIFGQATVVDDPEENSRRSRPSPNILCPIAGTLYGRQPLKKLPEPWCWHCRSKKPLPRCDRAHPATTKPTMPYPSGQERFPCSLPLVLQLPIGACRLESSYLRMYKTIVQTFTRWHRWELYRRVHG